ncbi:U32 family peptidase [Chitinispirillales bacterium ANBcel5]|uniref:peptidase U32 family protein n=1 Tax=Cellulosispirillum alkaliphilum TaxID=3039283 RepID=UPI002A4F89B4|nr:U32 family peptidase [Chitinispirillales bacterium ANBcel5]
MSEKIDKKIELLAPGGDTESVKAAICAGADAVYCGTSSFNARQRAANLSVQELENLARIAQQRDCRLYLTLNTLIFDHELPRVFELLKEVYKAGIRVVIVQDLGLLHLIRSHLPEIEVHASTQLTTHNEGQISFLSHFGVSQINISRELSAKEIKPLCHTAHKHSIKVEAFVHGAFCVSFSGQCYLSSNLCKKSGNRGECVQPCRRQYLAQSRKNNSDAKAVFNLKDNFVFPQAKALYDAGVDSFKIEGRIKKFAYVYNVTSAWREQVDALEAGKTLRSEDKRLETVFNRDFTSGYIQGKLSSDMFIATSRDQSLKLIANVSRYWADKKVLTLDAKTNPPPNTEILIYTTDFTFICKGILEKKIDAFDYKFNIEHKLMGKISKGCQVFTQDLSETADNIKAIIEKVNWTRVPLKISVSGTTGTNLKAVFTTPKESVTLYSKVPLSEASKRPLDREILFSQFSRLGASKFVLGELDLQELAPNCFIPQKELNRLRCEAVGKLSGVTIDSSRFTVPPVAHAAFNDKRAKKAFFIDDISAGFHLKKDSDATILVLPHRIGNVAKTAEMINSNQGITPLFSSILIGTDFSRAKELLKMLDGRRIVTDNSGIAHEASKMGIEWIAGPGFNIVNSYAVRALMSIEGFCGVFLSPEFSKKERGAVAIPPHIELWSALNLKRALMTSRQCLIRNISGCGKRLCDDDCVSHCDRSETVTNGRGKRFVVRKRPGFYTVVES